MSKKFKIQNSKFKILVGMMAVPVFLLIPHHRLAADNRIFASIITTNDPYFTTDGTLEDKQWYLDKIKIPDAWEIGKGSNNVIVAVIDTGIDGAHVELNDGRVIDGFNTVTNQPILAGSNSDDNGHGTAVAGIIGAIPNNGRGIAGINWNVRLMPIKALSADGTGTISSVAAGIVWAADHSANIINLSLGGQGFGNDATLISAITYAYNKGAVIVAAAGNDLADKGLNLDQNPVYPVCADNNFNIVIGVTATDINDQKANFSNFGSNCVDLSAPGKRILTTAFLPSDPSNNVLIYGSGTSLAAPMVSGVAALLKASNFNLSNVDIRNTLLKTADNIDSLNQTNCLNAPCTGLIGKGRVNALTALTPAPVTEGSIVRDLAFGNKYLVSGNTKRYVSNFVFNQRGFDPAAVISDTKNVLATLALGPALPPLDGTLIKSQSDPTVYIIDQGLRRALTYLVFVSRSFIFANVNVLPDTDITTLQAADWYWPPDGTMVLVKGNPTVYVMANAVRRPVTYFVFIQRKLSFAKVISVSADEFSHIPTPADTYWLPPLDGTLVKSSTDATVYVIENGTKRGLSFDAFVLRGYSFRNIKTLPQAEIDVIAAGSPIL